MRTTGNTVLITGGATGIGLSLAEALVRRGNEVMICGRRAATLKAARDRIPGMGIKVCDLRREASRRSLVLWALKRSPALNILVNNAGIQRRIDFTRGPKDLARADDEVKTNLTATIHLAALLIPHLKRKKAAAIVNVSSGLGFTPMAFVPVYSATKAAVHSLSVSIRHQLRQTSVRVFEVIPPIVRSELGKEHRPAAVNALAMSPEVLAEAVLSALEADQYETAVGDAAGLREQREALFEAINRP